MLHQIPEAAEISSLNALYSAIIANDPALVRTILLTGVSVKSTPPAWRVSPLNFACQRAETDIEIINLLIEAKADINFLHDASGIYPPLYYACLNHRADIVSLLLTNGANPYPNSTMEINPFLAVVEKYHCPCENSAACKKCVKIAKTFSTLLQHGLDVNAEIKSRYASFFFLAMRLYPKFVFQLIPYADVNERNGMGETVLDLSIHIPDPLPMISSLLDAGADPNLCDANGYGPLFAVTTQFCRSGCDYDCDNCGYWLKILQLLIKRNANVKLKNYLGDDIFHHAVRNGYYGAVRAFVQLKLFDVNTSLSNRTTLLMGACHPNQRDMVSVVTMLTELGADPDLVNGIGQTARESVVNQINELEKTDARGIRCKSLQAVLTHFDDIKHGKHDEVVQNELKFSWISNFQLKFNPLLLTQEMEIGNGHTGIVCRARYKASCEVVAIKYIDIFDEDNENLGLDEKKILEKIELERVLDPNQANGIAKYYGSSIISSHTDALIYAFAACGSLNSWIYSEENTVDYQIIHKIMCQLASSLAFLHQHSILHRDLKPKNIVLFAKDSPKIVDFGFAIDISPGDNLDDKKWEWCGTHVYTPPECFLSHPPLKYKFSYDVYGLGLTIREMICKERIYGGKDMKEFIRKMKKNAFHPSLPQNCPKNISVLLARTWAKDPNQRISAKTLAEELNAITPTPLGKPLRA